MSPHLHADHAAPAAAVLALVDRLIAAAQRVKAQDPSYTVSNETHLKRENGQTQSFSSNFDCDTKETITCGEQDKMD